jgi:hypothetical protein
MHETNAHYSHDLPYLNLRNITIREGLGKISNVIWQENGLLKAS